MAQYLRQYQEQQAQDQSSQTTTEPTPMPTEQHKQVVNIAPQPLSYPSQTSPLVFISIASFVILIVLSLLFTYLLARHKFTKIERNSDKKLKIHVEKDLHMPKTPKK